MKSVAAPMALLVVACLAGCGGGGGGGGNALVRPTPTPTPPAPQPTYSAITSNFQLQGLMAGFSSDTATGALSERTVSGQGSVLWTTPAKGAAPQPQNVDVTFTVNADATHPAFTFTQTFSALTAQAINVNGNTLTLYKQDISSGGDTRSIMLLDPISAGLSYATLGHWAQTVDPGTHGTSHGGWLTVGAQTAGSDIPHTGSALFNGYTFATLASGGTRTELAGTANATADFAARTVAFSANLPTLGNLGGSLSYPSGSNALSGTLSGVSGTGAAGLTGKANGRFYGPAAAELGGAYFLQDSTRQLEGAFSMHR